jgi:L-rhamnonate dehydratase
MSGFGNIAFGLHTSPQIRDIDLKHTVKEARAYVIESRDAEEKDGGGADCHAQSAGHWIVDDTIATPMSIYEKYKKSRLSFGIQALGTAVCEVELHDGTVGVGITTGGDPACFIIEGHLSRFVEGQDVRNTELMWDQMWKASINYGRKGLAIQALSAVDLALWDA